MCASRTQQVNIPVRKGVGSNPTGVMTICVLTFAAFPMRLRVRAAPRARRV